MLEAIDKADRRIKREQKIKLNKKFNVKNHRQNKYIVIIKFFFEAVIKIEVKDNNVEQALRVLKKAPKGWFYKIIKLKNTYEKPSEKKKRILQENIKRVKKLNKLKNRI